MSWHQSAYFLRTIKKSDARREKLMHLNQCINRGLGLLSLFGQIYLTALEFGSSNPGYGFPAWIFMSSSCLCEFSAGALASSTMPQKCVKLNKDFNFSLLLLLLLLLHDIFLRLCQPDLHGITVNNISRKVYLHH